MRLLVRVALVLTALVIAPLYLEAFEVPKTELNRLLGVPVLFALLVPGLRGRRTPCVLDLAVAAWLAVELLSTLASVSPRLSLFGEIEQREGLITSLGLAGIYVAARLGTRHAKDALATLTVATISIAAGCTYALVQAAGVDWVHWGRTSAGPAGFVRPFGTFGHPNLMGVMAAGSLGALAARLWFQPARRWIDGPLALITAAALIYSVSRGGWIGAAAGLCTALAFVVGSRGGDKGGTRVFERRSWPVLAATAVALVLLATSPIMRIVRVRLAEMLAPGAGSAASRIEIWRTAIDAFRARPLLGHGPDTFRLVFPTFETARYSTMEWGAQPFHAHSILFHTLATRGLLGLLALTALALAVAARAAPLWREGGASRSLAAAALAAAVGMGCAGAFGTLGIAAQVWLAVLAGSLPDARADARAPARGRSSAKLPPVPKEALVVAGVAFLIVAIVISREGLSSSEVRVARLITARGSPATAAAERNALREQILLHDQRAAAYAPWDSDLMRIRGEAEMALVRGGVSKAQATAEWDLRRAVALEPHRTAAWSALGLALLIRSATGDSSAAAGADSCYARALSLSTHDPLVRFDRAGAELALGRAPAALERSHALAARFPTVGPVLDLDARALWVAGRRIESLAEMELAATVAWPGPQAQAPWETTRLLAWMRTQVADSLQRANGGISPVPSSPTGARPPTGSDHR